MANVILPGVYITVRDEGLITVGGVSTGNVGIVGTALEGDTNGSDLSRRMHHAPDLGTFFRVTEVITPWARPTPQPVFSNL